MIKTKQYNDFNSYSHEDIQNTEYMLQEMKEFVANGGNLNLPILDTDGHLVKFIEYIKKRYDINFMSSLLDNELINNPFSFKFDADNKCIIDDNDYGIYWMRHNYLKYNKYILAAIKDIAQQIDGKEVNAYLYNNYDDKQRREQRLPPLRFIAANLSQSSEIADVWNVILENNKDIHYYMKDVLSSKKEIEQFLDSSFSEIRNCELANVFYKHNLINDYLLNNTTKINGMIRQCINSDDLQLFSKFVKDFDVPSIEKNKESHESFLRSVRSPEMVQAVIDSGCFTYGRWNGLNNNPSVNSFTYGLPDNTNAQTLSSICTKLGADFVKNHHQYFYNKFFAKNHNFQVDSMKILIQNNNFPIEKYDMLNCFYRVGENNGSLKWILEHGADPRNCHDFMTHIVEARNEGKKDLVKYRKEGLIDPFSPDMLFSFFQNTNNTKVLTEYFEKTTSEQISRYTKNGSPAWWGISTQSLFSQFRRRVANFNQTAENGDGWIHTFFKNMNFIKNSSSVILNILETVNKTLTPNKIIGDKHSGSNMFHHMFKMSQYNSNEGIDSSVLQFIFKNVDADFVKLLDTKDENDKFPLTNFFFFQDKYTQVITPIKNPEDQTVVTSSFGKMSQKLNTLINLVGPSFPFEQMIHGFCVIDLIKENYPEVYTSIEPLYLSHKLERNLQEKSKKKSIKI